MEELKWYEDPRKLAEARRKLGISQTQLAKVAGVSGALISQIEKGKTKFVEPTRTKIWDALAEIEIDRRKEAEANAKRSKTVQLSSLVHAGPAKDTPPIWNVFEEIRKLGIFDPSPEERLREENKALREMLETQRELNKALEAQTNWQPLMEERIRQLEEELNLLRPLLQIKTKESLLHEEAENLREEIDRKGGA